MLRPQQNTGGPSAPHPRCQRGGPGPGPWKEPGQGLPGGGFCSGPNVAAALCLPEEANFEALPQPALDPTLLRAGAELCYFVRVCAPG